MSGATTTGIRRTRKPRPHWAVPIPRLRTLLPRLGIPAPQHGQRLDPPHDERELALLFPEIGTTHQTHLRDPAAPLAVLGSGARIERDVLGIVWCDRASAVSRDECGPGDR